MAKRKQCQLINDVASGFVENKLCGSESTLLFQSHLETPPDGTFIAAIAPTLCTVTFTFHQCGGRIESRQFTPGLVDNGIGLAVAMTVPDVKSITATCTGGEPGSSCSFDWVFLPHYCRCCKVS